MSDIGILSDLLLLFTLAVAVVLVFDRIKLPPIVGFLITGMVAGPYGFGLIRNVQEVDVLANIGVILLLFTIGIEFSLTRFVKLRGFLTLAGTLQVLSSVAVFALIGHLLGQPWGVALFVGMLVALSGSVIVLRTLTDLGELNTPHGGSALTLTTFQDLFLVPMVLLTPFLAGGSVQGSIAGVLLKALAFVVGAVIVARFVVPRVVQAVVNTRQREAFLLVVVLLALGAAWASAAVGLSLALGAFIAGLVMSESEYSHQALSDILPLREVFSSIFFVSIGMLFDIRTVIEHPLVIAGIFVVVIVLKTVLTAGAAVAAGQSIRVAIIVGIALAQIGESSFVLSKVGLDAGLLDAELNQLFLAAAIATMAMTPIAMRLAPGIATWLDLRIPMRWHRTSVHPAEPDERLQGLTDHVIIVGYGLNGRNLARVLHRAGIRFVVLDLNPETVRAERERGRPILYGDASREEILRHAGVANARVMVIAISDAIASRNAVVAARRINPALHIVVRTRYVREMEPLLLLGTDEVVSEEFETSIEIFSRVLRRYLVPRDVIDRMIENIRATGYEAMRTTPEAGIPSGTLGRFATGLTVDVVQVETGSEVHGRPLAETRLRQRTGVSVVGVQRATGERLANPSGDDALEVGDVVLLIGRPDQLSAAAALFRASEREAELTAEARRLTEEFRAQ
jgi:monovalent cation:H+ antiporter-2, CPA2 family